MITNASEARKYRETFMEDIYATIELIARRRGFSVELQNLSTYQIEKLEAAGFVVTPVYGGDRTEMCEISW